MLNFEMDFCMHQDIDEIRPNLILQTFENFYKKQKKTKKLKELVELMWNSFEALFRARIGF